MILCSVFPAKGQDQRVVSEISLFRSIEAIQHPIDGNSGVFVSLFEAKT